MTNMMKTAKKKCQGFMIGCSAEERHLCYQKNHKHSSFSWLTCEVSSSLLSAHRSWWRSFSWCTPPSDWTVSRRSLACCWPERRWPPGSAKGESCWLDSRCGHRWTGRPVCAGPRNTAQAPGPSRNCQTPTHTAPEDEENIASLVFFVYLL